MNPKFIHPVIMVGPTRSGKSCVADVLATTGHYTALFEPITIWNIGRSWRQPDDTRDPKEATPQVIAAIREAIAKRIAGTPTDRFVDDLPHLTFRIDFCRKVFPEARFIMVTRDVKGALPCMRYGWEYRDSLGKLARRRLGRNRYRSISVKRLGMPALRWSLNTIRNQLGRSKASWGPTAPGQTEFASQHRPLETIAYQWAKMVEHVARGLESVPGDRVLRVRSEDLWTQQQAVAARLADFCELPLADVQDAIVSSIGRAEPHGAMTPLSDEEWDLVWPIIKDSQQRLEYPPPNTGLHY